MRDIKLIIFDLDGTLVDAYGAIIQSFNYTMDRLNYPAQKAGVIRRAVGWGDENLLRPFVAEKDLPRALSIYRSHHKQALLRKSRLFPRVHRVLAYLKKKGYSLAVASNRPTRFSWILIRHLKLKKYFAYIVCADRLNHLKPRPYLLNNIMQKFKLKPAQAAYIGDMVIDAQAGEAAKVKTIIVSTGSSSRREIKREGPYRIIGKISEVLKIL
jgi:phosphoglycolate phosphatase